MSFSNDDTLFQDEEPEYQPRSSVHRRKRRFGGLPVFSSGRAEFVKDLAVEVTPSIDFFLYSILCGLILVFAILLDAPVLYFTAALVSPLLGPVIGLSLASLFVSGRFFLKEAGSILVGALLVFLCGMGAGWLSGIFPPASANYLTLHNSFNWFDIAALTFGVILVDILIVRNPHSHLMGANALLAYELYLPVGIAGYGLVTRIPGLFTQGLIVFFVHLVWAVLIGSVILTITGLRPKTIVSFSLAILAFVVVIFLALFSSGMGSGLVSQLTSPGNPVAVPPAVPQPSLTNQPTLTAIPPKPSPSRTKPAVVISKTNTPTNTLIPSQTPTTTPTIQPTPVYARIHVEGSNGAYIREKPDYKSNILIPLLNGALIQLLPDETKVGVITWVHVRSADGLVDGWMMRNLITLTTTTTPPSPP